MMLMDLLLLLLMPLARCWRLQSLHLLPPLPMLLDMPLLTQAPALLLLLLLPSRLSV